LFSCKKNRGNLKAFRMRIFVVLPLLLAAFLAILFYKCYSSSNIAENILPSEFITVFPITDTGPNLPDVDYNYYYDIVVYGGTPSGLCAAIAASREGLNVAVLESSSHIGGMITGGLCSSDTGNLDTIGGLAKEFFNLVGTYYNNKGEPAYSFEPSMAEKAFCELITESGADVFYNKPLKENGGVQKTDTTITSITTMDECVFYAKVFIDCTYEGDLMAMSGVSYTLGREGTDKYSETLAGVRPFSYINNFIYSLSAYSPTSKELFPGILNEFSENIGQGDSKLPAYNFRLCITRNSENKVKFARPDNYDAFQYKLVLYWLYTLKASEGYRDLNIRDVFYLGSLPGRKVDANNAGPFSSDFIGYSWDYPEADYETREYIYNQHKEYLQGLLYFLANDKRVPMELRKDVRKWGLAADEFIDNSNWPYQLYIREGRRMIGDFVMTQEDLQTNCEKFDSIGLGSFPIDSHNVQRVVTTDGLVKNEGELLVPIEPYQLPYRIIVPKESEADNLLVTVCISASHVAYSSIRMEPQYMIMGQAAGLAAKLVIEQNCSVQKIDINALKALLESNGAVLSLP